MVTNLPAQRQRLKHIKNPQLGMAAYLHQIAEQGRAEREARFLASHGVTPAMVEDCGLEHFPADVLAAMEQAS